MAPFQQINNIVVVRKNTPKPKKNKQITKKNNNKKNNNKKNNTKSNRTSNNSIESQLNGFNNRF